MNNQPETTLLEKPIEAPVETEVLTPEAIAAAAALAERMNRIKAASNRAGRERRRAALR